MKRFATRIVVFVGIMAGSSLGGIQGCAVFRATGRSIEAVGEGTGHAIAGTGEAVSDAARETKRDLIRR